MDPYNILLVADLHVGSKYGMLPPEFPLADKSIRSQNAGQKFLWECWLDMKERAGRLQVDEVVVNGDVTEGEWAKNKKEISLALEDQEEAALFILRDLRNWLQRRNQRVPFIFVQGTEVHDAEGAAVLDRIAARVGGEQPSPVTGSGYCSYQAWSQDIPHSDPQAVLIHCQHGIGGGSGFARAAALDTEGVWMQYRSARGEALLTDLIVRSHVHNYIHVERDGRHMVTTPGWQLMTRHGGKNSAWKFVPTIGALVVGIDPEAKARGEDPVCYIHKIFYRVPPPVPNGVSMREKLNGNRGTLAGA